ncbi:MAG: SDR family oxidoreductase [Saprospiraceae bacterium]|nr:SDR family oxidoreductase [Saprospiraceae bacterium]
MDLQLRDRLFFVSGATSGFGQSTAEVLLGEGARLIINARGEDKLRGMQARHPEQVRYVAGDITTESVIDQVLAMIGEERLEGMLVNAGGPPAKSFLETDLADWDDAYARVLRWKVQITNRLLPKFRGQGYGRIVYIESVSVKQPIENLVLSNAMRLAVIGFVKTLSQEVAHEGITLNALAPGYHATPAMERLFAKKASLLGIEPAQARREFESEIRSGQLGDPDDLASLAAWLLSPHARYVTGQTIVVDGGLAKGTL